METVLLGYHSPLETLVLQYSDLYCLENKELKPPYTIPPGQNDPSVITPRKENFGPPIGWVRGGGGHL